MIGRSPTAAAVAAALVALAAQGACSAPSWPTTTYTGCATGPATEHTVSGCESEAEVQKVIEEHRDALTACWRMAPLTQANVCVRLTIEPDGSVRPWDMSSDAPGVATCVGDEMRGWLFPPHGCAQKTMVPLHFVRSGDSGS
jgi:hypothetical protein